MKKLLLGLNVITLAILPILSVSSCSNQDDGQKLETLNIIPKPEALSSVDFLKIYDEYNVPNITDDNKVIALNKLFVGVTKENLKKFTVDANKSRFILNALPGYTFSNIDQPIITSITSTPILTPLEKLNITPKPEALSSVDFLKIYDEYNVPNITDDNKVIALNKLFVGVTKENLKKFTVDANKSRFILNALPGYTFSNIDQPIITSITSTPILTPLEKLNITPKPEALSSVDFLTIYNEYNVPNITDDNKVIVLNKLFIGVTKENLKNFTVDADTTSFVLNALAGYTFGNIDQPAITTITSTPILSSILTKEIVDRNFAVGGIWHGLDTLNFSDLAQYTEIGDNAFYDNFFLIVISIPKNITRIGKSAFASSNFLNPIRLKFLTIEKDSKLTLIDDKAFQFAQRLTTITIPKTVTAIGSRVFETCQNLVTTFEPNSQLKTIGSFAFANNHKMTSFILPMGLESIGQRIFRSCNGLVTVYVPTSVTSIGASAFELNWFLENVTLPTMFKNQGDHFGIDDAVWANVTWI